MSIKSIERRSINDELLDQIKDQIISGNWIPGEKIPGEIELTRRFGVSRVSIRDAIHRLIGMGLLLVKRGEGTFVTEIMPKDYFSSLLPFLMIERGHLLDILEFRSIIEVQSAGLSAQRATKKDIELLEQIIVRMNDKRGESIEFAAEDLNFHTAIAISTQNSIIIRVNAIIHDLLKVAMEKIVNTTGYEGGLYYHKKILTAIKENNGELAMELMKAHINVTIEKMKSAGKE